MEATKVFQGNRKVNRHHIHIQDMEKVGGSGQDEMEGVGQEGTRHGGCVQALHKKGGILQTCIAKQVRALQLGRDGPWIREPSNGVQGMCKSWI